MATEEIIGESGQQNDWKKYDLIVVSQLQPGARIRIKTKSGSLYEFSCNEYDKLVIDSAPKKEIIGMVAEMDGEIKNGERLRFFVRNMLLDKIIDKLNTTKVETIEACNIAFDEITPKTIDILQRRFSGDAAQVLVGIGQRVDVALAHAGFAAPHEEFAGRSINVLDWTDLHAKVSAAIIKLFDQAKAGDIALQPEEFEEICNVFHKFIKDHVHDEPGSVSLFEQVCELGEGLNKKRYKMKANLATATKKFIFFSIELIND